MSRQTTQTHSRQTHVPRYSQPPQRSTRFLPHTSSSQLSHSSPPVETYVTVCPFRVSAPQYHDLRTQLGSSPCQVPLPDSPPAIPPMDFSVSSDPGHIEAHITTRTGFP